MPEALDMTEWDFIRQFVDLPRVVGEPEARWQAHAIHFFQSERPFTADMKSRKVAWSLCAAAWAVARCRLRERWPIHFVSFNKEEAKERVRDAKVVFEAIPPDVRTELHKDSVLSLEFKNGSRIISHSCNAVRGLRGDVVCDEVAFWDKMEERITQDVLPVATHAGQIRLGSTAGDAGDFFDRLVRNHHGEYGAWSRRKLPWWRSEILATDPERVIEHGLGMTTTERVGRWGTDRLKLIAAATSLYSFQREYECSMLEPFANWLALPSITACQFDPGEVKGFGGQTAISLEQARGQIAWAFSQSARSDTFYVGYDVGRSRHASGLTLLRARDKSEVWCMAWLHGLEYQQQEELLDELMAGPVGFLCIDIGGIGHELGERLTKKYPGRVEGVPVQAGNNSMRLAAAMRARIEEGSLLLPSSRMLVDDFRSVKQKGGRIISDEQTVSGQIIHADGFWSCALALDAFMKGGRRWSEQGAAVV